MAHGAVELCHLSTQALACCACYRLVQGVHCILYTCVVCTAGLPGGQPALGVVRQFACWLGVAAPKAHQGAFSKLPRKLALLVIFKPAAG
jgi:hypothetical protein